MINKIDKLENLLFNYLDDEYNEKNYNYDIIDIVKKFKKSDMIEFIHILLYALTESENDLKKASISDSFGFWADDIRQNKIILSYEKIEAFKPLELKNFINEIYKYNKVICYNFEYGYYEKEYNKNELLNILIYLEKNNNKIIQIYEEEKTLLLQIVNDDFYRV